MSRFVKIRTDIYFGTCLQKSFCNSAIFLANRDMQWGFAHIADGIRVCSCLKKYFDGVGIIAPHHDMKRGVAIAVSAGDRHSLFTHFGWEKHV
ncbi:hypothetical protein D3C78_1663190 [compost metagenome]